MLVLNKYGVVHLLADRLAGLRKQKKKTQAEVAKLLDITRPAYTAYETGRRQPDYESLKKLADYFEVSIDYLLTGEDQQGSSDEMWKEILDPKTQVFFKDLMSAPEEKIAELIKIWEIIKERDKK